MNPVLEKQEKAYCAFLISQSKVLAFSLLVTREHIHVHPWMVGYIDCLSLELEVGFVPPSGTFKKLEVLGSSKRAMDAGKLTRKYLSQPYNI